MHTDGMGLHDGSMAINVDDQPRQVVTFAMNEPVGIVVGIVGNTNGLTHLKG